MFDFYAHLQRQREWSGRTFGPGARTAGGGDSPGGAMSDIEQKAAETRAKLEKAHEMVSALCRRKGTEGSREWVMSIPARPDYDPDLVIGSALRAAMQLGDALCAAEQQVAGLTALARGLIKAWDEFDAYGQDESARIGGWIAQLRKATKRAGAGRAGGEMNDIEQKVAEKLPCGHPTELLIKSTESDYQFCELCNARSELRDALQMEAHYKDKRAAAEHQVAGLTAELEAEKRAERKGLLTLMQMLTEMESRCLGDYRHNDSPFKGWYLLRALECRKVLDAVIAKIDSLTPEQALAEQEGK